MISYEIINECKRLLECSDAVIIGAGAGLSTAAGLRYSGERFTENFPDFISRYGLTDMYSSAFYPFPTLEERWAYFSRHININRYAVGVLPLYETLLNMVKDFNYFVITTNGDAQFFQAGFDSEKIFATQGDYSKFQCEVPCTDTLYDNRSMVEEMVKSQTDCRIPTNLLPICPKCGKKLEPHLRIDETFVENENWYRANKRYLDFINNYRDKNIVLLELGVGFNTPTIIRFPFEQLSSSLDKCTLIRVNMDNIQQVYDNSEKSVLIQGDISEFINLYASANYPYA